MRARTLFVVAAATALLAGVISSQGRGNPNDWPTAYGDAQHSSWVRTDASISIESMTQGGFGLQWKTTLESPARQGVSLTQGVVTSGVNLFTPISTVAAPENLIFALDNDTGNLFWTRRFDGSLAPGTAACPGGISGAPTRTVNLVLPPVAPARGGAARGGRAYGGAVGEPGAGVPIAPPTGGGRAAAGRGPAATPPAPEAAAARGEATPAAQATPPAPASPFPTNPAAVAAAGGGRAGGGGLFRSSGVIHAVGGDGMFRTLGLVSGKDVQRPAPFLPSGARFSDLIAVGDMVYTATSGGCGGAPNGIWAISTSGDPKTVVSWKTNGGDPIGSPVFFQQRHGHRGDWPGHRHSRRLRECDRRARPEEPRSEGLVHAEGRRVRCRAHRVPGERPGHRGRDDQGWTSPAARRRVARRRESRHGTVRLPAAHQWPRDLCGAIASDVAGGCASRGRDVGR